MKRFSAVIRLTFWLVAMFAIVFLSQAQLGNKRVATTQQTKTSAHAIHIVDQNGQPAISGGPSGGCSWSAGPDLPFTGTAFSGVFFAANGKFYAMGGRHVLGFTHPFEYDPIGNSWTTKIASYPDTFVTSIECAVANDSGTDYIYCVGGRSEVTGTSTGRVFRYNPVADVITTVSPNWPPGDANVLPGGISVFNNKIYILGGRFLTFNSVTNEIWEFTPNPAAWVLKSAVLPVPRAYIPTTTIGNFIYTGGGADCDMFGCEDTTDSFKYDPVADSITTIASIPRATSSTRALKFCNQMYVMGGGIFVSNEVDIYDPVSDTWSIGTPFATARSNSATDTDGTNNIWLAGGSRSEIMVLKSTEIFNCPVSPCGPTPTPTATPTPATIQLRAQKKKVNGMNTVRLNWKGATSLSIDVYRNDVLIATTPNAPPFLYTDFTGDTGRAQYTYRVCEAGTQTCSNDLRVRFQE